jgi:hypothetical protein
MNKFRHLMILPLLVLQLTMFSQATKVQVGMTRYDLQTNNSIQRRIVVDPISKDVVVTYTGSNEDNNDFLDRGTGYAFYDKANNVWKNRAGANLALPVTTYPGRLEAVRTGWPNPIFIGNREMVISHESTGSSNGLNMSFRNSKGSGTWTNQKITTAAETWPRAASNGKDIMLISSVFDTEFEGVQGGLLFIKSTDSGKNWSQPAGITGVNIENYPNGLGGDLYSIDMNRNGVTAVLTGRNDITIYKTTNMGSTWTKIPIYPTSDNTTLTRADRSDGSYSVIVDDNNKVHCFWGVTSSYTDGTDNFVDLSRQGIAYWNENMGNKPPIIIPQTYFMKEGNFAKSPFGRFNTTNRNPMIVDPLGYNGGANVYNSAPVTWPSSGIDASGNLYLTYAYNRGRIDSTNNGVGIDEDVTGYNMYDVYVLKSTDGGTTWTGPVNVSKTLNKECTYPSMARFVDDSVRLVYQEDDFAGGAVTSSASGTPGSGSHLPGPVRSVNRIIYASVAVADIVNPTNAFNVEPVMAIKTKSRDYYTAINPSNQNSAFAIFHTFTKGCNKSQELDIPFTMTKQYVFDHLVEIYDDQPISIDSIKIAPFTNFPNFRIDSAAEYVYRITYNDPSGNKPVNSVISILDTFFFILDVADDTEAPVITLNGDQYVYVKKGQSYTELGFTATDNNNCTSPSLTNPSAPNTSTNGVKELEYKAKDAAGNESKIVRYVIVGEAAVADFENETIGTSKITAKNISLSLLDKSKDPSSSYVWKTKDAQNKIVSNSLATTFDLDRTINSTVKSFDSLCLEVSNFFNTGKRSQICKELKFSSSIDNINNTTFDVNVYPNPFNGIANVSIKGSNSKFASVKVIAQNGQEVFNGNMTNLNSDFPIDLSHLSKGIYILNIELDGQINSKKITIK